MKTDFECANCQKIINLVFEDMYKLQTEDGKIHYICVSCIEALGPKAKECMKKLDKKISD